MDYRNKPSPQDYLVHYGVLGQKWGIRNGPPYPLDDSDHSVSEKKAGWRKSLSKQHSGSSKLTSQKTTKPKWGLSKERLSLKTKAGETITLKEHPSSRLAAFLAKHSKRVAAEAEKTAMFDIKDPNGKTVGDITLYKESPTSINVVWVTTSEKVRGRGYGTAVMKAAIQIAKDTGANTVTLEVPGISPDARHIYEKLGFKEVDSPDRDVDDIWGGLTNMRLDLDQVQHSLFLSHSSGLIKISEEVSKKYASLLVKELDSVEEEETLSHHGIKGQKWGIRRYQNPDGTWTNAGKKRYGNSDGDAVGSPNKASSSTKKKVAIGAAIVAGTVLTAYLVKKYGAKNISDIGDTASAGKEILQDILKTSSVATTAVSQIPTSKVESKQVLERVAKSTPVTSSPVSQNSAPRVSISKPSSSASTSYSFETLMRQNDDLLKKMVAELA